MFSCVVGDARTIVENHFPARGVVSSQSGQARLTQPGKLVPNEVGIIV